MVSGTIGLRIWKGESSHALAHMALCHNLDFAAMWLLRCYAATNLDYGKASYVKIKGKPVLVSKLPRQVYP